MKPKGPGTMRARKAPPSVKNIALSPFSCRNGSLASLDRPSREGDELEPAADRSGTTGAVPPWQTPLLADLPATDTDRVLCDASGNTGSPTGASDTPGASLPTVQG